MKTNWKDIILGILVAYVAIDLMLAYAVKRSSPSCLEKMMDYMGTQSGLIAIAVGVLVGLVAWYLSSKSTERFTRQKEIEA